jgi:hypothetical protein
VGPGPDRQSASRPGTTRFFHQIVVSDSVHGGIAGLDVRAVVENTDLVRDDGVLHREVQVGVVRDDCYVVEARAAADRRILYGEIGVADEYCAALRRPVLPPWSAEAGERAIPGERAVPYRDRAAVAEDCSAEARAAAACNDSGRIAAVQSGSSRRSVYVAVKSAGAAPASAAVAAVAATGRNSAWATAAATAAETAAAAVAAAPPRRRRRQTAVAACATGGIQVRPRRRHHPRKSPDHLDCCRGCRHPRRRN